MSELRAPPGCGTSTVDEGDITDTATQVMELRERRAHARRNAVSISGELVRASYTSALRGLLANVLAVMAFVLVGFGQVADSALLGWTLATIAVLAIRGALIAARLRSEAFPEPARRLSTEYAIGAAATGGTFGLGFLLLACEVDMTRQLLLTLAMCGMSAGAALAMAAARTAFAGYTVASLGTALAWFMTAEFQAHSGTATATVSIIAAYFGVMVVIHAGARRFVYETISLQLENDRFVSALERYSATLSRDREEYRAASLTDALTGVANRRSFDEALKKFWSQAQTKGHQMGCLLIDVDHFKLYNDQLGHAEGDVCLRRLAAEMDNVAKRSGDYLARYGGEEFVLLAPNTTSAGTLYLAETMREAVEALALPHPTASGGVVTVSVGATSTQPKPGEHARSLVEAADSALYGAKAAGRNRVQLAREGGTMTVDGGPLAVATHAP